MLCRKMAMPLTIIASYKTPVDTRSEREKAVNLTLHCEDGRLP